MPPRLRQSWELLRWLPLWGIAFLWRTILFRTTFVAVTGSFGKTAAKDCLGAILSATAPTVKTRGNSNGRAGVIKTILKVRPWHRYAVIEAGTEKPGNLWRASLLIRPDVALILCVGRAHTQSFRTPEAVAAEKASLLRFLRPSGLAVLNGDDPYVSAMSSRCPRAMLFGSSEEHALRHWGASSIWPECLSFQVEYGGERAMVWTQFVGTHRMSSVAGAITAAIACGVPLRFAVEAVRDVQTHTARLQPVTLPSGAVLLRDEYNGSIDSFQAAADVLRHARARRRVLIMSDCSDWSREPRKRMRYYAQTAKECAEAVVFLGERSDHAARCAIQAGVPPENVRAFLSWEQAVPFLRSGLRSGDLALLRGIHAEHLSRLYFSLIGSVACRKPRCGLHRPCDECPELGFLPDAVPSVMSPCAE